MEEKFDYHIFPPFIDAFINDGFKNEKITLSEIEELMKVHANQYGEESIGRRILMDESPAVFDGKFVVCCAYVGDKQYLMLVEKLGVNWFDNLRFTEGVIKDEWDVT